MKRCSISLIIGEMQIKTMRYHFTPVRKAIIKKSSNSREGMEKRESSYTVGRNINWYIHYGKQYGGFLKELKTELPYDLATPILGIYLKKVKTLIQKDICTPMFIASLLIITKIQRQPKCP